MNTSTENRRRYPRWYGAGDVDLYFGRKKEIRDLTNLLMVEKLVVLFSKSGAGKTSLLKAGVEPVLLQNGFFPIHIRLNSKEQTPEAIFETTFRDQLAEWNGSFDINEALGDSFWELVKSMPFEKEGKKWVPVFIFRRFEEFFTTWPKPEDRDAFIKKLAGLLSDRTPETLHNRLKAGLEAGAFDSAQITELEKPPEFRVLISVRNDTLHLLDEMSQAIPAILRCRYQLFPFKAAEAREVILRPASRPGEFASEEFSFSPLALEEILAELGTLGEVEPAKLQLFCSEIEDRLIAQGSEPGFLVTPEFYGGAEGIRGMFEGFYEKQLTQLSPEKAKLARRVLGMALLTPTGKRHSVESEEIRHETGVSQELLNELETLRLIRSETRLDSVYYEIAQESLVPPIREARLAEEEADRWAERKKQETEAQAERARVQELADINSQNRRKAWLVLALLLVVTAILGMYFKTVEQREKAEEATRRASFNWNALQKEKQQNLLFRAKIFEERGELLLSEQKYREAFEADSTNEDVRRHFKRVKQRLGKQD